MQAINSKYKDSVFRTLFSDEDKLIELYNALFDTNYGPEANIEIVTLEDVVFRVLKNDVAFVMEDSFIVLAEHQSRSLGLILPVGRWLLSRCILLLGKQLICLMLMQREKSDF